ncbi:NYN domain-containing protein [Ruegeria sp. Alg231-54]|uniref:NYN domain-containing protein n=1 Tax=Ruegeria sp. Alg231-54 TaxID=1922221 RepID=UPI000D555F0D|nr:NYN domain-containing protein [Ruegeria sp. Alg231-54]
MILEKKGALNHIPVDTPHRTPHFAFVDADNMQKSFERKLKDFGVDEEHLSQFSFVSLFKQLLHDRIYFYSAAKNPEELPEWLKEIRAQEGFVLKLGVLTQKGRSKKQEGVDVKLAIDATKLAFTSTMKTCTLYGADGDFIPLVEALSDAGCIVNVVSFNDPSQGRVAPRLQAEADSYKRIDGPWLYKTGGFRFAVSESGNLIHGQMGVEAIDIHGEHVSLQKRAGNWLALVNDKLAPIVYSCASREQLIFWLKMHTERLGGL